MTRALGLCLVVLLQVSHALLAAAEEQRYRGKANQIMGSRPPVDSTLVIYMGGTTRALLPRSVGRLSVQDSMALAFEPAGPNLRIPYARILDLEYGRVEEVKLQGIEPRFVSGFELLTNPSSSRVAYLTITYTDEQGVTQTAIFQLREQSVKATLHQLEVRAKKKIDYEWSPARRR